MTKTRRKEKKSADTHLCLPPQWQWTVDDVGEDDAAAAATAAIRLAEQIAQHTQRDREADYPIPSSLWTEKGRAEEEEVNQNVISH